MQMKGLRRNGDAQRNKAGIRKLKEEIINVR